MRKSNVWRGMGTVLASLGLAGAARGGSLSELCGRFFGGGFLPHGHCYYFQGDVLWLNLLSDGAIALSYFSIPFGLIYFALKRKNLPLGKLLWLFGAFILLCGMTHALEVYNIWHGAYYLSGSVKGATALVSLVTAFVLIKGLPFALQIPMPGELRMAERARVDAEERLTDREELLDAILRGGPGAFLLARLDLDEGEGVQVLRIQDANQKAADWFERPRKEMASLDLHGLFGERAGRGVAERCLEAVESASASEWEMELGPESWAEFQAVPAGSHLALSWTDISYRKRTESELLRLSSELEQRVSEQGEKLWRSDNRYKLLTEFVNDVVWRTNEAGAVTSPMPSWERFSGQTFEQYRDFGWLGGYIEKDRERMSEEWRKSVRSGEPFEIEAQVWKASERRFVPVAVKGIPLRDESGAILEWIGGIADLTQQKASERELENLASRLYAKNQQLEDFTHLASHDLQEPLRKIRAYGDLLKEECSDSLEGDGATYLEVVQNAAARLSRLIEDLRAYSLASTRDMVTSQVELGKVVDEAAEDLERSILEAGAKILRDALPVVPGDFGQLQHVFQNLLNNAIKYRRKDVPLVVRISGAERFAKGETERTAWGAEQRLVEIRVEDNGIGFDQKYADRIFRPFQRLHGKGKYEGSGMGLSICRQIVQRHNGTIQAEAVAGQGAAFVIVLPVSRGGKD